MNPERLPHLQSGQKLGPYTIAHLIGAGGMGQVYRARDSRLGRDVALKVLPRDVADDPDRRRRFEHEARSAAALNHPHIVSVYDVGSEGGVLFVVTELLTGQTLRELLERGPLTISRAVEIAAQVADGLAAAHAQGTVHRDLKPDNIFITTTGTAKILDFGLATAASSQAVGDAPTRSLTAAHAVLGTPNYMAPEQVRGDRVDHRADIFAFGCVLYEMITGRKAFDAATVQDAWSAILRDTPAPIAPAGWEPVPAPLQQVVERCLQKARDARFQSAADLAFALRNLTKSTAGRAESIATTAPRRAWLSAALAVGGLILGAAAVAVIGPRIGQTPTSGVTRTAIPIESFTPGRDRFTPDIAMSPDGRSIAYSSNRHLVIRRLDQFQSVPLSGTQDATLPVFSPDGKWLAFIAGGRVQKISVEGGPPLTVCEATQTASLKWVGDELLFAQDLSRIVRVSVHGGTPETIVSVDPSKERLVQATWLPGRRALLVTHLRDPSGTPAAIASAEVAIHDLETGTRHKLVQGSSPHYFAATGNLIYGYRGSLFAVPVDLTGKRIVGTPTPVVSDVVQYGIWAFYDLSNTGALAYIPGGSAIGVSRQLIWIDRAGKSEPLPVEPRAFEWPSISPDGQRAAFRVATSTTNVIRVYDVRAGAKDSHGTQLTGDDLASSFPIWTPDGESLVFAALKGKSQLQLYRKAVNGLGAAEALAPNPAMLQIPWSFTPDGQTLLYSERQIWEKGPTDVRALSMPDRSSRLLWRSEGWADYVAVSRDGRWIAYTSNESGDWELYVRPFPKVDSGRWKLSTGGARAAHWDVGDRRLTYSTSTGMHSVSFDVQPAFRTTTTRLFPEAEMNLPYDTSPDGQRFLVMKDSLSRSAEIRVILNWGEEVRARVGR